MLEVFLQKLPNEISFLGAVWVLNNPICDVTLTTRKHGHQNLGCVPTSARSRADRTMSGETERGAVSCIAWLDLWSLRRYHE